MHLSLFCVTVNVCLPAPGPVSAPGSDSTSSTIDLWWEVPDEPHGEITEYEVYWKAQRADCGWDCEADLEWNSTRVNDTKWHREDLCPYRPYQLIVSACTIKGCGDETIVNEYTEEDGR